MFKVGECLVSPSDFTSEEGKSKKRAPVYPVNMAFLFIHGQFQLAFKETHDNSEAEERKFLQENDSKEYIYWSEAEEILFSILKPSNRKISIRIPEIMIEEPKLLANKRNVPYQSLLKTFLSERINSEFKQ